MHMNKVCDTNSERQNVIEMPGVTHTGIVCLCINGWLNYGWVMPGAPQSRGHACAPGDTGSILIENTRVIFLFASIISALVCCIQEVLMLCTLNDHNTCTWACDHDYNNIMISAYLGARGSPISVDELQCSSNDPSWTAIRIQTWTPPPPAVRQSWRTGAVDRRPSAGRLGLGGCSRPTARCPWTGWREPPSTPTVSCRNTIHQLACTLNAAISTLQLSYMIWRFHLIMTAALPVCRRKSLVAHIVD